MWLLVRWFNNPNRPKGNNTPSWYTDKMTESEFLEYLYHKKHLYEDWRSALYRWYFYIFKYSKHHESEIKRLHKQRQKIRDIISKALKYGYFRGIPSAGTEIYLESTLEGREFLKSLNFLEACLEKYNRLTTFFLGVGTTGVITFWDKIINYILKFLY